MALFKSSKPPVSIVGAGNIAWHLLPVLENAGYPIAEIYNRTETNAQKLSERVYQATVQSHLDFSNSKAGIILIAVKDDAIQDLVEQLIIPENCIVAHTSGTIPISVLEKFKNRAVLYPIQTFSKNRKINFKEIPFCIETTNDNTKKILTQLVDSIGGNYSFLNSEDRKQIHLAAVFACNFTNHLLGIANELLDKNDLDFAILKPLIEETVNKAFSNNPYLVQTGPAIRKDEKTLKAHLQLLQETPELQEIYKTLSANISKSKNQK